MLYAQAPSGVRMCFDYRMLGVPVRVKYIAHGKQQVAVQMQVAPLQRVHTRLSNPLLL